MNLANLMPQLRGERRPIKFLASRLLWRTGACRLLSIPRNGYRIRFYPTSISAALWLNPQDLTHDETVLSQFIRPGDTVVDVGANIGTLTLHAASRVGPSGSVHSFEANPRTYQFLRGNVRLNRLDNTARVHGCALGDAPGLLSFTGGRWDDMAHISENGEIKVEVRRLDDVLGHLPSVSVLKIDVEGFEIPVLRGAKDLLRKTELLYVESFEPQLRRYGFSTAELISVLTDAGFSLYRRSNGKWHSVSQDHVSSTCENLLGVSLGARERVAGIMAA